MDSFYNSLFSNSSLFSNIKQKLVTFMMLLIPIIDNSVI